MQDNIIEVEGLVKSYGAVHAVQGISFAVARGSLFSFLGVNGAGKSTTINILCSILATSARLASMVSCFSSTIFCHCSVIPLTFSMNAAVFLSRIVTRAVRPPVGTSAAISAVMIPVQSIYYSAIST